MVQFDFIDFFNNPKQHQTLVLQEVLNMPSHRKIQQLQQLRIYYKIKKIIMEQLKLKRTKIMLDVLLV